MLYSRSETEVIRLFRVFRTKTCSSASRPRCPRQPRILEDREAALEEDEDGEEVILSPPSSSHKAFVADSCFSGEVAYGCLSGGSRDLGSRLEHGVSGLGCS